MKLGVLTSTRADFGIYLPLIKELKKDNFFNLEIIAFGTHLSEKFGYTINEINNQGFEVKHQLETIPKGDSPKDISESIGETTSKFANFWNNNKFDLVLTLGDRFEMFAAVAAASPFNIKFAHIHAGETTLGAIDNAYRHSISLMSEYLFVSTNAYKNRAIEINKEPNKVFNVGALSIDNLKKVELFTKDEFLNNYNIDLNKPTILSTFHPETVSLDKNEIYIDELLSAFKELQNRYQIVITMPNSDTQGLLIRDKINEYGKNNSNVHLVESFGMKGYLSCMKHCRFMVGNTSSGFAEAAFFPKWVINLGERQKGRTITPNIKTTEIKSNKIISAISEIENIELPKDTNIYGNGNTAIKIVNILKEIYAK